MYLCVVQFHASHTCSCCSIFLGDSFSPFLALYIRKIPIYPSRISPSIITPKQADHIIFWAQCKMKKWASQSSHIWLPKPRNWTLCTGNIWNLIEGKREASMSCLDKTMELPTQAGNKCHLAPPKTQWSTSPALLPCLVSAGDGGWQQHAGLSLPGGAAWPHRRKVGCWEPLLGRQGGSRWDCTGLGRQAPGVCPLVLHTEHTCQRWSHGVKNVKRGPHSIKPQAWALLSVRTWDTGVCPWNWSCLQEIFSDLSPQTKRAATFCAPCLPHVCMDHSI